MRVGKGITVLEFYFLMLFFNKWKRLYINIILGVDNVVRLVTGYKLWIITYANVLISGENGIVFMDDFFGVPLSICTTFFILD